MKGAVPGNPLTPRRSIPLIPYMKAIYPIASFAVLACVSVSQAQIDIVGDQVISDDGDTIDAGGNINMNQDGDIGRILGGTVTSGGINVGGSLSAGQQAQFIMSGGSLDSGGIETTRNARGTAILTFEGGVFDNGGNGANLFAPFAVNGNAGNIEINFIGGDLKFDSMQINTRLVTSGPTDTFGIVNHTGSEIEFRNFQLGAYGESTTYTISGGELINNFGFRDPIIDNARFEVVGSAPTVEFRSDLTVTSNATIGFTIQDATGISSILVNNTGSYDGTIDLTLDGYMPGVDEAFTIFSSTGGSQDYSGFSLASDDVEPGASGR